MGKKHRELAQRQALLEGKIDIVAAAVGQPQHESAWTRIDIVTSLVLTALALGVVTLLTLRQLRQAELANVISATAIRADTLQEEAERANAALRKWGRGEFTDTAPRPEEAAKPRRAGPPPAPKLVGVMQADSGKVDSAVAQLAAVSSLIIPTDSVGNPYVRHADGRARVQIAAAEPAPSSEADATGDRSAMGGAGSGGGSRRKGLWVGPYGELICAGTCAPGQVCCLEHADTQR